MSRISALTNASGLFVAYLTVGDGGCALTVEACKTLVRAGVDVIELGVPFSDPIADGPVIQRAACRALQRGTTMKDALHVAKEVRKISDIPILLFTYLNPLLSGAESIYAQLAEAEVDGVLVVDLPLEESRNHRSEMRAHGLSCVFVATPSTSDDRIRMLSEQSEGFLYFACRNGVTGARESLPEDFTLHARRLRTNSGLPFVAGFGIADRHCANEALAAGAGGFVVGSALVRVLEQCAHEPEQCMQRLAEVVRGIDPRAKTYNTRGGQ